jgi:putative hydrolase of the HAD superfamily
MAKDFGWAKDLPASYTAAAKELGTIPAEILFTDDKITNVEAAEAAGITSIHFENNQQFIAKLEKLLTNNE